MTDNNRYARQTALPEIGTQGQDRLARASVLGVGAGGLGSAALLYLAAAGIGRIGIIDFDRVEASNLQRQVLFSAAAVGQAKAVQAAERLRALNPSLRIEAHNAELTAENAAGLFADYDFILDGTDNFKTKFLINEAAVKLRKPWVYGAVQGFTGQAAVFNFRGSPCYQCGQPQKLRDSFPKPDGAVIGALPGIVGAAQALQLIELIAGHEDFAPLIGKIWFIDGRTMQTRLLNIIKNPHCSVCGGEEKMMNSSDNNAPAENALPKIAAAELKRKTDMILLDVREAAEYQAGHIKDAVSWPLSRLAAGEMPALDKNAEIIVYCQKGKRSLQALPLLKNRGFANMASLTGGYEAWQAETADE